MRIRKIFSRCLALLLTGALGLGLLPGQALAYWAEQPDRLTFVDQNGSQVAVTEDWETAFPYGTFAFSNFQAVAKEGGDTAVIQVYRLGGTQGRAVAYISYAPVLAQMEDGGISYSTAAGSEDIIIEVEDPMPGAENQPIGQPAAPEQPEPAVPVRQSQGKDGVLLSIDAEAEAYQWYVFYAGGWEVISGATDREMLVGQEKLAEYDFRCVFTVDGTEYCSDSYLGVPYEAEDAGWAEAETPETQSEEPVDLNPEPTYTRITPEETDNPYAGYVFDLTFADGEWVKEIRVTAPEDTQAEALKFGTFTIVDNLGASLYDTANTLALQVVDNDAPEESQLGFVAAQVRADKAAGTAEVTVRRTGGNQSMLTIDYVTEDGSAKAGEDYAAASGTLTFYGDLDEQIIRIPLIDDGEATEEEVSFRVVLSNLKGDGGAACTLGDTAAVVTLYNSGQGGEGENLATYLHQNEVTDLSASVTEAEGAVAPVGSGVVAAQQVENRGEALTARIGEDSQEGISLLSYNYPNRLTFNNGGWSYAEQIPSSGWSGGKSYDNGIWTYRSEGAGSATLTFDTRMYEGISARFDWECSLASGWTLTLYGMEYTYPWARLLTSSGGKFAEVDSGVTDNGSYLHPKITWHRRGSMNESWTIAEDVNRLRLGTSRHDSHDSDGDAEANLESGNLYRRSFNGDFYLQIHTANDSGEGDGNTRTAPEGAAALTESSGVYDSMRPVIAIPSGQGGVSNGKVFVGSTLQVTLQNTASYTPATTDENLTYAVYLTNDQGRVVASSSGSGTTHYLQLLWDGMTDDDVRNHDYTVNVVMTRSQDLNLDLTPSVPRLTDENGNTTANIDPDQIQGAVNDFWASTSGITYGYSDEVYQNGAPITYHYHEDGRLTQGDFNRSGAVLTRADLANVQWINFNLPEEDRVVYNGRTYNGNDRIYLCVADLASSNMTFYYYDSQYLNSTSIMTANVAETELFLDGNANGRIDGYYDAATGYFVVDPDSGDQSFGFLDLNSSYSEMLFQPVAITMEDGTVRYGQYFMKVYYTMNARSLVPPAGVDTAAARAQVLPAFVSTVTDPDSYEALTEEQKSYRYLISGLTRLSEDGELVRTSDNHPMYGAEATQRSMVDVPLGGDISPAEINEEETAYTWTPDYQGNLLYPFENPEPIFIANSVAGSNIPVAEIEGYADGEILLEAGGVDKLNGYLGSFTANNTVALCVQEQAATTEEIAAANGVTIGGGDIALQSVRAEGGGADRPQPESVSAPGPDTTPDARYLQETGSAGDADGSIDMGEAGSDYPEFDQDFHVELPSADIGVLDFGTILMDGDEVGFTIGLPMGGYNSNGDAGASGPGGGQGSGEWSGPWKAIKAGASGITAVKHWIASPHMGTLLDEDDSYHDTQSALHPQNGEEIPKKVSAKEFAVNFSVAVAFLWKFDPVSNSYQFSQFAVAGAASLSFAYQVRFTPVPILYLYVTVEFSLELGTGATVERETVEGGSLLEGGAAVSLETGEYKILEPTQYKSSNLTFDGKLLVEAFTDEGCTQPLEGFQRGYLSSSGADPVLVVLEKRDEAELDQPVYIRLTAIEDTELTRAMEVVRTENLSYWSGFTISPELFVQAGVGVGIEIMKFEVYIKINLVGCSMTLGDYDVDLGEYTGFNFDSFEVGLGLGFQVVLLIFSYEMDLISYSVSYEDGRDPEWQHSWSALGGLYGEDMEVRTLSATDANGNTYGVHIRLPGSSAGTQAFYSADTSAGSITPFAFDPTDDEVPFQLSGYSSSGDAFKLADGLISGYDYQVVTVGDQNYLLYTVSRTDAGHPVDNSMLVLSRIQLTSTEGSEEYGLVNPVDVDSETPYLVVDDDGTGDLEFSAWADGETLRMAWVSYDEPTDPVPPAGQRPAGDAPGGMDESNYAEIYHAFTATAPEAVADPGNPPAAPEETDYVLTPAEYASLPASQQRGYERDPASGNYFAASYGSYTAAQAAYAAAQAQYETDRAQYAQDLAAYEQYLADLAAYEAELEVYEVWYTYFLSVENENAGNQAVANAAARNTVVKTASFDTVNGTGIAGAATVSGAAGSHVYLPGGSDDGVVTIYARARHYDSTAGLETQYDAYLSNIYTSNDASQYIKAYRQAYQKGLWDAYGSGTELHAVVNGVDQGVQLPEGEVLDNMEITEIGGVYYVAYTTSQQTYVSGGNYGNVSGAEAEDMLTTKRLYLQTLTMSEDAETAGQPVWGQALLLRTLVDYDQNTGTDGIYQGGALGAAYQDPYFSNLQFLNGKLGGLEGTEETFSVRANDSETTEEFLLFEMNGSTYVIPEDDLVSIAAEHTGSILPFFQPEAQMSTEEDPDSETGYGATTPSSTGRAEATIGVDGAGNISAVYVSTVAGTTNNALFLTKWDPVSQTWGAGTMLAMNYMQVYEDAAANGWSNAETEQAYLGRLDGYDGGGMDQFTFSNLQIALGQTAAEVDGASAIQPMAAQETGSAQVDLGRLLSELGAGGAQTRSAGAGSVSLTGAQSAQLAEEGAGETKDTLLVLTQGTTKYLQEGSYTDVNGEEQTMVVTVDDDAAQSLYTPGAGGSFGKKPGVGVYAISYGVGQRSVGNANVDFSYYDFTVDSELYVNASFQNTGDVALRGSEANPITAQLMLRTAEGAEPVSLATWEIPENITAGQTVYLTGSCDPLTQDLPDGSIFYLTVAEDETYITDGAFSGTTLVYDEATDTWSGGFVVESGPELGFEQFAITSAGVDETGNTILDVDFQVGNRGTETAEDVYVQFSYETGRDENNNPTYTVLDITGHDLTVSGQQQLQTLSLFADNSTDEQAGILRLVGTDGTDEIDPNMGRTVSGTLTVPPELYQGTVNGSLNLRVEIFSAGDMVEGREDDGLIIATHGEYDTANNSQIKQIEHTTFVTTAAKVTLAMGNTMRLPVSVATSTGRTPVIQVEEIPDGEGAVRNLGVLYYEQTAVTGTGNTEGALVIAPSREGTGIIHIKDEATNTIYPITYEVTAAGEGINIFRDNGMFTFYNADGSVYDESAAAGTQDWTFVGDVDTWGSDGSRPYLSNLSNGQVGARFTFDTMAESIDFRFNGSIQVESTYPGFTAQTLTCAGGQQGTSVYFGNSGQSHTVTVTVLDSGDSDPTADFDVLVEHFAGDQPPVPAEDANYPHLYWSRSFPDTAALTPEAGPVTLTLYALDDTGIANLTVNGAAPENVVEHSEGYWSTELTVAENGTLTVAAVDNAGNRTGQTVTVDWFNAAVSAGARSGAPGVDAHFEKNGAALAGDDYVIDTDTVLAVAQSDTPDVTYSAQRITVMETEEGTSELDITSLDPESGAGNTFDAKANGYYLITATAADGTWSQVVLEMAQVDTDLPVVSLSLAEEGETLAWSVSKPNPRLSPITQVTLNGYPLEIAEGRTSVGGTFPIQYGGDYTLAGRDAAGHQTSQTIHVNGLPIQAEDGSICTVTDSWNQARNNGVITIDPGALTGGLYDGAASDPGANAYQGRYQVLTVRTEDIFDAGAVRQELLQAYAEEYFQTHPDAAPDDPNAVMPEEELNAALDERETAAWSQWRETVMAQAGDASWQPAEGIVTFEDLAPGGYAVLFRDANDPRNGAVTALRILTVGDEAIVMTAESSPEYNGNRDGTVTVDAQYGRLDLGTYQFLIRPVDSGESALLPVENLTDPLDPQRFPEADGWTTPVWQTSDLAAGTLTSGVFSGLRSGWYQVAVRTMEGVSAAEMQTLVAAYQTMAAAQARVEAADAALTDSGLSAAAADKTREIREALQTWQTATGGAEQDEAWSRYLALIADDGEIQALLTAWQAAGYADGAAKDAYDAAVTALTLAQAEAEAQAEKAAAGAALPGAVEAYEAQRAQLEARTEAAYGADPSLWDNAATMLIRVQSVNNRPSSREIEISDLRYDDENGRVEIRFTSRKTTLSDEAEERLIQDNESLDIRAYSDRMEVWIPAGTLSAGDDVMEMLMPFAQLPDGTGNLVQYTGSDGETHPVVWSYVTAAKVYYVASAPGRYEIVQADVTFPDVPEDFWGLEAIGFTAARGLFQGDGAGQFQPEAPMTRAMFVTVLCRLAGVEPEPTGTSDFTDVAPDAWYAPYVAWAAEAGIVTGYGDGRFGPEDPVSREQMCVLLDRLLTALGVELPEGSVDGFADAEAISGWAVDAVGSFAQRGLIQGVGEDRFAPSNKASRAEVAALYMRLIQRLLAD